MKGGDEPCVRGAGEGEGEGTDFRLKRSNRLKDFLKFLT